MESYAEPSFIGNENAFQLKKASCLCQGNEQVILFHVPNFFGEVKTVGIYILKKKVLLVTHLPISPMLNAAVQVTSPRNSGWSRRLIYRL